jgi:DNA replication protein DnaC
MSQTRPPDEELLRRAQQTGLYGVVEHLDQMTDEQKLWLADIIDWEEAERGRRSLERRLRIARLGAFKPMADFDWTWPSACDREALEDLLDLRFLGEAANAVLLGPNGVGKTTIAKNIAHQAVLAGHTVAFVTASQMLNDLASQDGASGLERRLRHYCGTRLLCIDELGYLSYGNRHADLLFEVVSRRYEARRSLCVTTNKPFAEWNEIFPNAACVVTLVDRLVHRSDIVSIEAESYRLKEAKERASKRRKPKKGRPTTRKTPPKQPE